MADTRTDEERRQDLFGVRWAAQLVGIEELERWRGLEGQLHTAQKILARANEVIAMLVITAGGEVSISRDLRTQIEFDRSTIIETHVDPITDALVVKVIDG